MSHLRIGIQTLAFLSDDVPEQKRVKSLVALKTQEEEWLKKFSSLDKLIRISALILRFDHNTRVKAEDRITGHLTTQELLHSNLQLVKLVQGTAFKKDLQALKANGQVSRRSNLSRLFPFIDKQGVIRVGGHL